MVWTLCDPIATNALPTIVYYRLEAKKFHSFKSLERNWKEFIWSHAMADWDRGCTSIECHCKEGILVVPLTRQSNPLPPPSAGYVTLNMKEKHSLRMRRKKRNSIVWLLTFKLYCILSLRLASVRVHLWMCLCLCVCVLSFGCIAFFISTVYTKREACECTTDWVWIERNYFRCCGKFSSLNWQILIRNSQAHPSTHLPTYTDTLTFIPLKSSLHNHFDPCIILWLCYPANVVGLFAKEFRIEQNMKLLMMYPQLFFFVLFKF